jgi:hypothetical protein
VDLLLVQVVIRALLGFHRGELLLSQEARLCRCDLAFTLNLLGPAR